MSEPIIPPTPAEIEQALASLPARERDIFLAVRLDGLTYAEIANQTGLTVKQVETHIADALYHLRRHIRRGRDTRPWWRRIWA